MNDEILLSDEFMPLFINNPVVITLKNQLEKLIVDAHLRFTVENWAHQASKTKGKGWKGPYQQK